MTSLVVRRVAVTAALVAAVGVVVVDPPRPAAAAAPAVIAVTTSVDVTNGADGLTSLREAFVVADGDGVDSRIVLPEDGHHRLTDCAQPLQGQLIETESHALELDGQGSTIEQTCAGGGVLRSHVGDVTITDVTITGGREATDCCAGGITTDAGVGSVTLDRVLIVDNESSYAVGGGGLYARADGAITIRRTTIAGNRLPGSAGGGARIDDSVLMDRSAIVDNEASASGGGLLLFGGGSIRNSTIAGNRSGGLIGGIVSHDDLSIVHGTVAANRGSSAQLSVGPTLTLRGTVLADPGPGGASCTPGTAVTSLGYNYATTTDCGLGPLDAEGAPDPQLRRPFRNGGSGFSTLTMHPEQASLLRDHVPFGDAQRPAGDQRGFLRTGKADIGALETFECDELVTDVQPGDPFCWEIAWVAGSGVSAGFADGSYGPGVVVSRQSMAAFLYNLSGAPAFVPPAVPTFADVPATSPFFAAVEWLVAEGVASGFPDGTFKPTVPVSRQAMAAFLHNLAGNPFVLVPPQAFSDVPPSHPFFVAVSWIAAADVAGGFVDGSYGPTLPVSRQAMASFLYRYPERAHTGL